MTVGHGYAHGYGHGFGHIHGHDQGGSYAGHGPHGPVPGPSPCPMSHGLVLCPMALRYAASFGGNLQGQLRPRAGSNSMCRSGSCDEKLL